MQTLTTILVGMILLTAALILVGCSREVSEANLFHPQPVPDVPGEPGRRDVEIVVDEAQSIRGWYFYDRLRPTTLIYFYGNGETTHSAYRRARWLVDELGMNVMLIDYRGYGYSDGTPGIEALLDDSLRIFDAVASAADTPQRVLVYGRSIGTAPAIHLASQRELQGLILEAPFTTISDVIAAWDRTLRGPAGWVIRLKPEERLATLTPQPLNVIADLHLPLLVIHGEGDTVIPMQLGRRMFDAAPEGSKTWVQAPGVGHNNLPLTHPEVEPALRQFAATYADLETHGRSSGSAASSPVDSAPGHGRNDLRER